MNARIAKKIGRAVMSGGYHGGERVGAAAHRKLCSYYTRRFGMRFYRPTSQRGEAIWPITQWNPSMRHGAVQDGNVWTWDSPEGWVERWRVGSDSYVRDFTRAIPTWGSYPSLSVLMGEA